MVSNLDNVRWFVAVIFVVETGVTRRHRFKCVIKIDCNLVERKLELQHDAAIADGFR